MSSSPAEARSGLQSASLLLGSRLVNLAVGIVSIPVFIRYLTGTGFAAWALLLALAAGFALLELGVNQSAVRYAAEPLRAGDSGAVRSVFGRAWLLLACSFGIGGMVVVGLATELAAWLRLPDTPWLSASQTVIVVLVATALRGVLQSGTAALTAAGRFGAVAGVSLAQPLLSNVAAMMAAWKFQRLDVTLVVYWAVQIGVLGCTFFTMRQQCWPRFSRQTVDAAGLRAMWAFGLTSQLDSAAQFASFQFDKLLISSWVGLWAVAPYEVANRAAAALRSLPASTAEMQLPTALAHADNRNDLWRWYLSSSRLAVYAVAAFLMAPMAAAPVFLYAWTGEMGYTGRWTFMALALGAMANLLALPAAVLLQVQGRTGGQARAALLVLALNVPLSLLLVGLWGSTGAALGTAIALTSGSAMLVYLAHREFNHATGAMLLRVASYWPLVAVCLFWGTLSYALFEAWFVMLEPAVRYSRATRVGPGLAAVAIYTLCVVSMLAAECWRGAMTSAEQQALMRWLVPKWRSFDA